MSYQRARWAVGMLKFSSSMSRTAKAPGFRKPAGGLGAPLSTLGGEDLENLSRPKS